VMMRSVRSETLERFGSISCARTDIAAFELYTLEATIAIFVRLKSVPQMPLKCAAFDISQAVEADRVFELFRQRANRQTLDHTLDFEDLEAVPIEQRKSEMREFEQHFEVTATDQAQASANIGNVTLEEIEEMHKRRQQSAASGEQDLDADVDKDADVDDKVKPATIKLGTRNDGTTAKNYLREPIKMVAMKEKAKE
jgi:hypothetical protein